MKSWIGIPYMLKKLDKLANAKKLKTYEIDSEDAHTAALLDVQTILLKK